MAKHKLNKADQKAADARKAKQQREDREAAELQAQFDQIRKAAGISRRRFFGRSR